jgi:hypothetical protein
MIDGRSDTAHWLAQVIGIAAVALIWAWIIDSLCHS